MVKVLPFEISRFCGTDLYLVVLAESLPEIQYLSLQLTLVLVTVCLPSHLLGGGEDMEGLLKVEFVLVFQCVWRHVGKIASTNLLGKKGNGHMNTVRGRQYRETPCSF